MDKDLFSGIVRILDAGGSIQGTGFLISENLAVTCAHVVNACGGYPGSWINLSHYGTEQQLQAYVEPQFWRDETNEDVALLRLSTEIAGAVPLHIGYTRNVYGHGFSTLGFPNIKEVDGVRGSGEIIGETIMGGMRVLQLESSEVTRGFSGAPIFDVETQRVIGMITSITLPDRYARLSETAFALPSEAIQAIYGELPVRLPEDLENYLMAVRKHCSEFPYISLHDIHPQNELNGIYVSPSLDEWVFTVGDSKELKRETARKIISSDELFGKSKFRNIILLGEAGVGKSTLLRHIAANAWNNPKSVGLEKAYIPLMVSINRVMDLPGSLSQRVNRYLQEQFPLVVRHSIDFFREWETQANSPWLLLLDGLDEIPMADRKRPEAIKWLLNILGDEMNHRILVTSRPSAFDDKIKAESATHWRLLPFTRTQTEKFAERWFNESAPNFLKEFSQIRAGELTGTPLLLTIAAAVFKENGQLPLRTAGLYKQFVDILMLEAEYRGLEAQLDLRIRAAPGAYELHFNRLGYIALRIKQTGMSNLEDLANFAADFLMKHEDQPVVQARMLGKHFIEVMAQHSGIFRRNGDAYQFMHATFQDFFVAYNLVHRWSTDVDQFWRFLWKYRNDDFWLETVKMCASLMAEELVDIGDSKGLAKRRIIRLFSYERGSLQKNFTRFAIFVPIILFVACILAFRIDLLTAVFLFFASLFPAAFLIRIIFELIKSSNEVVLEGINPKILDLKQIIRRDRIIDILSEAWCPTMLQSLIPRLIVSYYERDKYTPNGDIAYNYRQELVTDAIVFVAGENRSHEQVHFESRPVYRVPDKWYKQSLVRAIRQLAGGHTAAKLLLERDFDPIRAARSSFEGSQIFDGINSLVAELAEADSDAYDTVMEIASPLTASEHHDYTQYLAVRCLAKMNRPNLIPILIGFYQKGSTIYKKEILDALAELGGDEAFDFVQTVSSAEGDELGIHAKKLLEKPGSNLIDPAIIDKMIREACPPSPQECDSPVSDYAQRLTVRTLARMRRPAIVPVLIEYYSHGSREYKQEIISALAEIRGKQALNFLQALASTEENDLSKYALGLLDDK